MIEVFVVMTDPLVMLIHFRKIELSGLVDT